MFQTRCMKCGLPLETPETIELGLGDTCLRNVEIAFNSELDRVKDQEISAEKLLMTFSALGEDNSIGELIVKFAEIKTLKEISFNDIVVIIKSSRKFINNGNEHLAKLAIDIIGEYFPATLSMAKGEASLGDAILTFDRDFGVISLTATTVRRASELLCKIPGVRRYGYRGWTFEKYDFALVYAIVIHHWPLATITDSFINGSIEFMGEERPKQEKVKAFTIEAIDGYSLIYIQMKVNGQYKFKYHQSQEIRSITDSLGFMWLAKKTKRDEKGNEYYCYLVEDSKIDEFESKMKRFEM